MSTRDLAYINGEVLRWARERAGETRESIANALKVEPEAIEAWETGTPPPFSKAETLAHKLRIPLGYLFLSKPPKHDIPIPDLRTLRDRRKAKPSVDFLETVELVLAKQQWCREYLAARNSEPLKFVGNFHVNGIQAVARNIVDVIKIDEPMRQTCTSWEQFLRGFVQHTESVGVLVMRNGFVGHDNNRPLSVTEFRGLAISDTLAPLVFINAQDAKAAQIFTLAHELAHIWIGESGISNPDLEKRSTDEHHEIERFCNRVAAEVLVPKDGFVERWDSSIGVDQNAQRLARYYRVSAYVVLRQAYELNKITGSQYVNQIRLYEAEWERLKNREEDTQGNFYANLNVRHSKMLVSTVVKALAGGEISYLDASRLLQLRTSVLKKLEKLVG